MSMAQVNRCSSTRGTDDCSFKKFIEYYMTCSPKSIITRGRLLDELWDAAGEFVTDNTLTVYIKRLREKIEDDPSAPRIILTVRGTGYRLGGGDVSK